jgi:multiple sugar transport system permease protein
VTTTNDPVLILKPADFPSPQRVRDAEPVKGRWRAATPYLLVTPAVIYLLVFMAYPLIREFQLSFTATSLLSPTESTQVGLDNYATVMSNPDFGKAALTTLLYAAGSVLGALALGLGAALVMNQPLRGRVFVRSAITLPWAAPPIAVALIFAWMFNNQYGIINFLLLKLGLIDRYQQWLDNQNLALPGLLIVTVWMTFPICALILLAAMQSIPRELYEASKVDKASAFNRFLNVTIPGIRPTLYVVTLLLSIWALRRFDIIWVMTQGGPVGTTTTLVVNLYREAFQNQNLGVSAAIGIVGLLLSVAVTVVYFIMNKRSEQQSRGIS